MDSHIFVCIPAINEEEFISATIECIRQQDMNDFTVLICVNQPESWWKHAEKKHICENNIRTLKMLPAITDFPLKVIDRSSHGRGWAEKEGGVGWARKSLMDAAVRLARKEDIILSLDADTCFNSGYFSSVRETFRRHKNIAGLSVPYYHRLTGKEREDRAILRYEIYMRNYALNMWRIGSPYNFTALGSAMACTAGAYKAIGGMTAKHSGEDFYFLQKLRKYGPVLNYNPEKVFPAARFSDRVNFGTGPAMIKGDRGDWDSYPVYHWKLFDEVRKTYDLFPALFRRDVETPMSPFLRGIFRTDDLWQPLRGNFNTEEKFIRACHEKVDGLRILQFLKSEQKKCKSRDEQNLCDFLIEFYPAKAESLMDPWFSFIRSPIVKMDAIRDFLMSEEEILQCTDGEYRKY